MSYDELSPAEQRAIISEQQAEMDVLDDLRHDPDLAAEVLHDRAMRRRARMEGRGKAWAESSYAAMIGQYGGPGR